MDIDLTVATGRPAPRRLAQYELMRCVGSGAMGTVFQARDVDLDRIVAMKLLYAVPDAVEQSHRHERFMREARAAARLTHPNVAIVYQVGNHEGQSFIAMEWVDGGDLADWVKSTGAMRWPDALAAAIDAAAGLAAAHAAGLVHRDIKPSNLMRLADGRVKVVDFGLARWHDSASELTATGALLGSPAYMSPELCSGLDATPSSDVYALGCTLFQLLAGRPPYPGPHIAAVLQGHVNEPVPSLDRLVDGLPRGLGALVERALAKLPSERYPDAGAMLLELRRLQAPAAAGDGEARPAAQETASIELSLDAAVTQALAATSTMLAAEATSMSGSLVVRGHVPGEPSRFIGREVEATALAHALATARIVTLTGPGGTGKSRLSLHVARAFASRCVAWFVELAPLAPGHDVAAAVAAILELREEPGESPVDALGKALRDEPTLLVLDNCEHVLEGAAALVDRLGAACPRLQIIATSRQPLGCAGELVLPVPPLSCGDDAGGPRRLLDSEAVRLFAQRAQHARPGFAVDAGNVGTVASICRQLDGLPLAIELAAARVKVLSLAQIAARLTDMLKLLTGGSSTLEPRQQTLRALIDWSYELLDADERRCFECCSIFAGEFGIEAAEVVLADDDGDAFVLDTLAQLVDKSLLVATERGDVVRYHQLQTMRHYAAGKLRASGEHERIARRHAVFFRDQTVDTVGKLRGEERAQWLPALQRERDNILAALDAAIAARGFDVATPLIAALGDYWFYQGRVAEGVGWVERFIAADPPEDIGLAAALTNAGKLALFAGRHDLARRWQVRALELARRLDDAELQARCLDGLGSHARMSGHLDESHDWHLQAIELSRRHGLRLNEARSLNNLAIVHDQRGHLDAARELYEAAGAIHRELGRSIDSAIVQMNLGTLALRADDPPRAEALFASCLEHFDRLGDSWNAAYARGGLGECALLRGDTRAARQHFDSALVVVREAGDHSYEAYCLDHLARVAFLEGHAAQAEELAGRGLSITLRIDNPADVATALETMAWVKAGRDVELAASLFGCAEAVRERAGAPAAPLERRRLDELEAELVARLDPVHLERALQRGRAADPADMAMRLCAPA